MKIGCFALVDPFTTLDRQLDRIRDWGFGYADITDNTDGGCLGAEYGFTSVASLDANPYDLSRMFTERGLTITSYCAHANLLDPSAPWRYQSAQIIKAVRAAASIGVGHVITSEGEPRSSFGQDLSESEALMTIREKLYEPLRFAADCGVRVLLEPHGRYTSSIDQLERLLELCDSSALGVNLDTGNVWLGGHEPVELVRRLGERIEHVHWKDLGPDLEAQRGSVFGCGMSTIPLGTGLIDIEGTYRELEQISFGGYTTLEVAGEDNVLASRKYLQTLGDGRVNAS